ncbi:MAG: hypothetical protein JJT94_04540 [Bernardetiaceae bacterium]|nr:hypothetical protein [Bernardetiaceae bacterium]
MTRKEAQTLLDSLAERLEYYRSEKAITAYAPLNFDLKKRIEDLEEQIQNLRNLLAQSQAENIEFPNLARLKKLAFMDLEAQDKSEFIKVSYSFLKDCKNVVKDSVINAKTVHIGDVNYLEIDKINKADIDKKGNIILQDINGATIHIAVNNLTEVIEILQKQGKINEKMLEKLGQLPAQEFSDYDYFQIGMQAFKHNQYADTSLPLAGKNVDVLSKKALKKLFAQELVKKHFIKHRVSEKTDTTQKLKVLNLMSNGWVLKGTFLCLANVEQIRSVSSSAHTSKFFSFEDTKGLRTGITEFIQGNLIEQFEQMIAHIKQNLYLLRDIDTRTDDYQIPEKVFTELLANAFIHRDYHPQVLSPTKVELYPDRMEIYNAGQFPPEIDLEKIGEIANSVVINPEIVQLFFLHGLVETSAKGIKRSQEILKSRQMKPAVFEQTETYVKVTIYKQKKSNHLDYAYLLIDEKRISEFFDWAEKFEQNQNLTDIKQEFISGKYGNDFYERLKVLAKMIFV